MSGFEPYFLKTQWCVAQAVEQADIDFLLDGGWEPYSTQFHPTLGQTIHYFRKQKAPQYDPNSTSESPQATP